MLDLDDPRWADLSAGYGLASAGEVPALIRVLAVRPDDQEAWAGIWSLYHQGDVFPAAFAAIPHLIQQATALPVEGATRHWAFVGAAAASDQADPDFLQPGYEAARRSGRAALLTTLLEQQCSERAIRYLLLALMTLSGHPDLSSSIDSLAEGELELECPHCDHYLIARPSENPKTGLDLQGSD